MGGKKMLLLERIIKKSLQWTIWKSELIAENMFSRRYKSLLIKEGNGNSDFSKKLKNGEVNNIKMVGDSITVGVGSWSYHTNKYGAVILSDKDGRVYNEPPSTIWSWTNFFKKYVNEYYSEVSFQNYGIGGKSAKWFNERKEKIITSDEDVVFVMLGTNDRWDVSSINEYELNLKELLKYTSERSNLMYVISPPPTLNDQKYDFSMDEINEVIERVCKEQKYNLLSQYKNIIKYSKDKNLPLEKLLQTNGGSHPIQRGYDQMWVYFQREIGL